MDGWIVDHTYYKKYLTVNVEGSSTSWFCCCKHRSICKLICSREPKSTAPHIKQVEGFILLLYSSFDCKIKFI